jgi:magnesium chelatase subunit I
VDGLRADLVMLRAARALAAWENAGAIDVAHVRRVSALVLAHRGSSGAGMEEVLSPPPPPRESSSGPRPGSQAQPPEPERTPDSPRDTGRDPPAQAGALADPGAGDPAGATDWGALAPEPVGIERVKPLRPLLPGGPAKKA